MSTAPGDKALGHWLLCCCAMLLLLVMVGGATRLTGSGLSIVEWRPVTGILPPTSEAGWQAEMDKYRQSPEYQKVRRGMSLADFKKIYWFEYFHRLVARLLGVAFALPLAWFWWRGRIPAGLRWPLAGILALGAAQGYMGWFMVKSGLADIPRVSPYRLAAHLGLALTIYAAMLWVALGLLWPRPSEGGRPYRAGRWVQGLLGLVVFTILSGAFVAGLRAGHVYNTFPLMDGRWIPDGLLHYQPLWRNFFENPLTVQFVHRYLALSTLLCVITAWWLGRREVADGPARLALHGLLCAALIQVAMGIGTLLWYVPVWLGTLHQGGAVIVLSAALTARHALRRSGANPVTAGA